MESPDRTEKRLRIVSFLKQLDIYKEAQQFDDAPPTPDATNTALTKRAWEHEFVSWKKALKATVTDHMYQ